MKKLFLLIPALMLGLLLIAQPPKGPATAGMTFGDKTTAEGAVSPEQVAMLVAAKPAEVKVKGKVTDVCKMMGCWLKMETTNGTVMIKMKEESFFVPLSITGKTVVAKGIAAIKETSVKSLRHYAEDAGKTKEEVNAIKEPKTEITMEATGILVL